MNRLTQMRRALITQKLTPPEPEPDTFLCGYFANGLTHLFDGLQPKETTSVNPEAYTWHNLVNGTSMGVGTQASWNPISGRYLAYVSDSWRNAAGTLSEDRCLDISKPFTVEMRCKSIRDSGSDKDAPERYQDRGGSALTIGNMAVAQNGGCDGTNGVLEFRVFANSTTGENKGMQIFVGSVHSGDGKYGYCSFADYGIDQKEYHTYTVTHNGKGTLKYYCDAVCCKTEIITPAFYNKVANWIKPHGSGTNGTNQRYFIGYTHRIAIYSRCLTDEQVALNYANDILSFVECHRPINVVSAESIQRIEYIQGAAPDATANVCYMFLPYKPVVGQTFSVHFKNTHLQTYGALISFGAVADLGYDWGGGKLDGVSVPVNGTYTLKFVVGDSVIGYLDDVQQWNYNLPAASDAKIVLGRLYNVNRAFSNVIYGITITDSSGALIANLEPAYIKSTGALGLYNTIDGSFIISSGTREFTQGPDI